IGTGEKKITSPLKPLVAVPTGSGTGFEITGYAVVEDMSFFSHFLTPNLVVIDPRMVRPEDVTSAVSTAMTALAHSAEAFTSPAANPLTEGYAFSAINYVKRFLVDAVMKLRNKQAAVALANAASMAGCAFSSVPPGMVHKLGLATEETCGLSAGISMGILLPYGLEYNMLKNGAQASPMLPALAGFDEYSKTGENDRSEKAVDIIRKLQAEVHEASKKAV
ncbi:MAG: iron-containing alcohol dehydrogenase, partial [bacterium]|nr:iron-containing alcohol dehydrogenase [bacterium]